MKAKSEFWSLSPAKKIELILFYLLILFFPTQLGKHFWPDFSFVLGQRIDYLSPTIYLTDILLLLLLLVVVIRKKLRIRPFFLLFTLFLAVRVYFSPFPLNGWYLFFKFLEMSFFVWYVAAAKIKKFFLGILFSLGILGESMVSFTQVFLHHSVGGIAYLLGERSFSSTTPGIANASLNGQLFLRPYATFSHPNVLGGYVGVVFFLLFYFFFDKTRVKNVVLGIFSLMCLIIIFLSLGRVVIVGWIFCFLFLLKKIFPKVLPFFAIGFTILGVALFLISSFFPEIIFRFFPLSFADSVTDRILLANSAVAMIKAHPLFGIGLGNFLPALPSYSSNTIILQPVHTIYLLIASELGLIGLFFFLFILWKTIVLLFEQTKNRKGYLAVRLSALFSALTLILFTGMFDHYWLTLQQGQLLFSFVLGLSLAEGKNGVSATIRL